MQPVWDVDSLGGIVRLLFQRVVHHLQQHVNSLETSSASHLLEPLGLPVLEDSLFFLHVLKSDIEHCIVFSCDFHEVNYVEVHLLIIIQYVKELVRIELKVLEGLFRFDWLSIAETDLLDKVPVGQLFFLDDLHLKVSGQLLALFHIFFKEFSEETLQRIEF